MILLEALKWIVERPTALLTLAFLSIWVACTVTKRYP